MLLLWELCSGVMGRLAHVVSFLIFQKGVWYIKLSEALPTHASQSPLLIVTVLVESSELLLGQSTGWVNHYSLGGHRVWVKALMSIPFWKRKASLYWMNSIAGSSRPSSHYWWRCSDAENTRKISQMTAKAIFGPKSIVIFMSIFFFIIFLDWDMKGCSFK